MARSGWVATPISATQSFLLSVQDLRPPDHHVWGEEVLYQDGREPMSEPRGWEHSLSGYCPHSPSSPQFLA